MCGCRDEGLLEPNGKTYMLSLKVYETVKTDVAYVQDKTVSQIQAKDRILEYPFIGLFSFCLAISSMLTTEMAPVRSALRWVV